MVKSEISLSGFNQQAEEVFTECPDHTARRHGLTKYVLNERRASYPSLGDFGPVTTSLSLYFIGSETQGWEDGVDAAASFDSPLVEWDTKRSSKGRQTEIQLPQVLLSS